MFHVHELTGNGANFEPFSDGCDMGKQDIGICWIDRIGASSRCRVFANSSLCKIGVFDVSQAIFKFLLYRGFD